MARRRQTKEENGSSEKAGFATIEQAQEYLSLSRATLYKLMDQGDLAYAKFGPKSRRIPWAALRQYGERCTVA
jgi:excisionase family DNA binding protein